MKVLVMAASAPLVFAALLAVRNESALRVGSVAVGSGG